MMMWSKKTTVILKPVYIIHNMRVFIFILRILYIYDYAVLKITWNENEARPRS